MASLTGWVTGGLNLVNQVLSATIVLTSFSLLIYLLTHNLQSAVARAFCSLLTCVLVVYAGDVALYEVATKQATVHWLKFQWIGIALAPAAYLHFSEALLRTVNLGTRWHRVAVYCSYLLSVVFLGLVWMTDQLVYDGVFLPYASRLAAGPLFWVFALYFFIAVAWGAANVVRARHRCLTRASRRRMTYLSVTFVAPALGVFPYLLLTGIPTSLSTNFFLMLLLVGNVAILLMLVVMAYSVAYFGALTPDRVVKHSLIHYLLRGPLVGAVVIFIMLAVPKVEQILGLPRDTVLIFTVVAAIVLLQLAINLFKPFIDRIIYRQDRGEIVWIQTLDRRLLTTADLQVILENTLAALCDLLQVRTGFVAVKAGGQYHLESHCGDRVSVEGFLQNRDLTTLIPSNNLEAPDSAPPSFVAGNGFWLVALHSKTSDLSLGMMGVEARGAEPNLEPPEQEIVAVLIDRAQEALEDRYLQQGVFDTLGRILPDIERLHRWHDATRYAGPPLQIIQGSPIHAPEFQQWVKDALSHYWGGPRLTESPLLELQIVRDTAQDQGSSPAHALRTVLYSAIERLRPDGERKMTAAEWILYNILEMKFIRGLKVRDIAHRLAISESDLYRKQRVAIGEVARALADLEQDGTSSTPGVGRSPNQPETAGLQPGAMAVGSKKPS
jgi:hypothetical protein